MPHIRTDNQPVTQITVIEPEPRRIGPSSICCPWSAPVTKKKRIVHYGNVLISGGVTSGIDFAFRIVAELAGPEVAQAIQLAIEYDPSPPFDAGHPEKGDQLSMAIWSKNSAGHTQQ